MLVNLEPLAALTANNIIHSSPSATDAENIVTKSLAVLSEQGLYAFGLFLATRKRGNDQIVADNIHRSLRTLLDKTNFLTSELKHSQDTAEFYRELTAQNIQTKESSVDALRRILLIKQMFEITLTYARYAAKARKIDEK